MYQTHEKQINVTHGAHSQIMKDAYYNRFLRSSACSCM